MSSGNAPGEPGWHCPACGAVAADGLTLYRPGVFNLDSLRFGSWCRACGARALFTPPPVDEPTRAEMTGARPSLVLLISGSCASGKSTVSRILAERHGVVQIDGDWILELHKTEPGSPGGGADINSELRHMAHGVTRLGMSAVIAHIVLPDALPAYQSHFASYGITWRLVILLPDRSVLLRRAEGRATWPHPTPAYWIDTFQDALSAAPPSVRACFHDNSTETPGQAAETIWRRIQTPASP